MYTYKDVKQYFNPKAKTWTLSLPGVSQETYGCRSRPPRWSDKVIFARYVSDKRPTPKVKLEPPICSLYNR